MTQTPDPHDNDQNEPQDGIEETLAERSARLEAEAMAFADAKAHEQSDPLSPSPEPDADLYNEEDPLNAGEGAADGHLVILRLQKELEEANDKMVRAVAETENIRRRSVKERDDSRKYSIAGFSKDIVNVADNLRRALDAVPAEFAENEQLKGLIGGIEATERELLRAFEKNGIKKMESTEGVFDPNLHEVMFETPGTGQPAGTIIQTLEQGYMLHDRLLRPARVGVAKDEGGAPPESAGIDTEV